MANTIATAIGQDRTRRKEVHRLGSCSATVKAATWRTFVNAIVYADGSGRVTITRDGKVLACHDFEKE